MKDDRQSKLLKFIWFTTACGADSTMAFKLYGKFDGIEKLFAANFYDVDGITDEQMRNLLDKRLDSAFEILKRCNALGVRVLCFEDSGYPDKLKTIYDPPLVLYCKGKMLDFNEAFCIGMVGTRNMSNYGMKTAQYLANGAAEAGAVVISGLAKGIDSACQRSALNAGGLTVGVIGNSIDTVYPKESAPLFNRLYTYGLIISEYWPGCSTNKYSFPRRNRIIAALSNIVVVVEAPAKSGSLITASHAMRMHKPVYVPPMPLTVENAGTAALLRGGARLITSVGDLLAEYEAALPHKIPPDAPLPAEKEVSYEYEERRGYTKAEERELAYNFVLDELEKNGPETLQQVAAATERYTIKQIMNAATALELDGYVIRMAGGRYDALPADPKQ